MTRKIASTFLALAAAAFASGQNDARDVTTITIISTVLVTPTPILTPTATISASASASASATTPVDDISTSLPSPTAALNATLPSQAALAPRQAWCTSDIFCAGPLLQNINIAQLYGDSKTFVDKPTTNSSNVTLAAFNALFSNGTANYSSVTYGALQSFVEIDFQGEGLELTPIALATSSTPAFLSPNTTTIIDPLVLGWAGVVNSYWDQLIRQTNSSTLCDGVRCESSLIPLNHTFVVPGGRFREQYYWDSYWIVEGLLQSELYDIVNSTLQNFMDELDTIGFIPNGGRIYYKNRSQPPLFMKMLYAYVNTTKDTTILDRALPLAEVELAWWHTNRTVNVTSSYSNATYEVARYAVVNTAPRPEGYLEDYLTANGADIEVPYTDAEKADLYAELASGAESGLDYSSRWLKNANLGNATNTTPALRTLNVRSVIPVDLNSILYKYRTLLADLYDLQSNNSTVTPSKFLPRATNSTATSRAQFHRSVASSLKTAILDLFWDPTLLSFYDYNLTSSSRSSAHTAAFYYPFWSGIIPPEVANNETAAISAFSSLRMLLSRYNGTIPASWKVTGLQWDAPNAWPPHQFIALEALRNLPTNVTTRTLPVLTNATTSFSLIPVGQLGISESELPPQPLEAGGNATGDVNVVVTGVSGGEGGVNQTSSVLNGGNATAGENWADALGRELANRYISSVFCSWYSTGGSIPGLLAQLPADQLNVTFSNVNSTGHMYEKMSAFDIDASGSGGEYTVQAGFGWTNGAVLSIAARYGAVLAAPHCPAILVNATTPTDSNSTTTNSTTTNVTLSTDVVYVGHRRPGVWKRWTGV